MATENKDKDSLARLAKALERSGDKERLAHFVAVVVRRGYVKKIF